MKEAMSNFINLLVDKTKNDIFLHPFLLLFITLSIISITFKWLSKPSPNKNSPPSPRGLPVLGNLHQLSSLPHQSLRSMAEKHGPIMLLNFGSLPTLIASSSAAAEELMRTRDITFAERYASRINRRLLYDCKDLTVSPYGEHWRQLRSICVLHLLTAKRVQSFRSIREEETELLLERIRRSSPGCCLNLSKMFIELSNDVVCRSTVGRKYSEGESGEIFFPLFREFLELLGSISIGDFIPWLSWINRVSGFDARVDKAARDMDEFLEGVILERLEASIDHKTSEDQNFLDILLGIHHNNSADASIDRVGIKTIILDVFAGGTDTTSTVLEWAMTEVLRQPKILETLQNEVRQVMKDKVKIREEDIEKMPYLKAVIKETLRCHPPIPMLIRVAREDAKIMGYDVPAGTMVVINAWAIGRDPASWDEPEKFQPDRFLNSSIDYKGLDFELIPFGAGRRGCPGMSFAMATNELVLANLVHKFDWKLPNDLKSLDMRERPGIAIHKAVPLLAIASHC